MAFDGRVFAVLGKDADSGRVRPPAMPVVQSWLAEEKTISRPLQNRSHFQAQPPES